mmetsp:Transcript_12144/g.37218  ORF Transcript_12144/g.37218 Transcript_12144/m.37218 type:complete len:334 (+) Transcript_12144:1345-2346(+)
MGRGDDHRVEHLLLDVLGVDVDQPGLLADTLHCGLGNELREVGARVAVRVLGELLQVGIRGHAHALRLGLEDGEAAGGVGRGKRQLAVEASESAQRWVDVGGARGGCQHDDALVGFHPVEKRKQLRHNALLHLALRLVAFRRKRVQLVDEDDGGRVGLGLLKNLAQRRLSLARPLGHDLGPVDRAEPHARLGAHRLRDHRLARAGRPVDDYAARRPHAQMVEHLGLLERQVDELPELCQLLVEPANVRIAHSTVLHRLLLAQLILSKDLGLFTHNTRRRLRALVLRVDAHHLPPQNGAALHRSLEDVAHRHRPAHPLEARAEWLESVAVEASG